MDPYVERGFSGDFRASLTVYIADAIWPFLPADLRARLDRRTFWEGSETRGCEHGEAFIKIREKCDGRVFTVVNLLSPENKIPGSARDAYLQTQREAIDTGANLVEIDLIRTGQPTTLVASASATIDVPATYHASIFRRSPVDRVQYLPMPLRQRLPPVPIPLRATDSEVMLTLQPLVDRSYERGRYDADTDYSRPLSPPLSPGDDEWAQGLIRSARP